VDDRLNRAVGSVFGMRYISIFNINFISDGKFVSCNTSRSFFLQVYEMYVTGYQFKVLSPVFTGHWGLQTRKTRPAWRERQNSANRKQFETFKKEVFARYMRDPLKMMKNANWRKIHRGSHWWFETPPLIKFVLRLNIEESRVELGLWLLSVLAT